ncbi:AMP-binding protein [Hyphomonas sp. FCG-A18]|jgi:long-chain acyl-CoA synthetase|uniref:AMP-binding protein n=1 Tax=Hyphomonas sp. FCG-A18 TaxID=3080019 RepID=UPI002B311207|nr:AMP-binding protein [Hyphomonas sp. FCG-A18]
MANDLYMAGRKTERSVFLDRAKRLAAILSHCGIGEDDAVAVLLRNDTLYMEVIEACRHLGAYFVTLNWHGSAQEVTQILEDAQAKVLIGHSDLTAKFSGDDALAIPVLAATTPYEIVITYGVNPAIADGQEDLNALIAEATPIDADPLRFRGMLAYTSGSTGRPKGIRRAVDLERPDPYQTYAGLAEAVLQLKPGDRFYTAAPLYHSAPNALSTFCMAAGFAELHISPKFDAETFLSDVERFGITHCYIVPTMMVRLLKLPEAVRNKYDTSTLRFGISTGSAWPRDVKQAMIDWLGPIFYESYGASEIGFMTLISSEEAQRKPGSVGKVLPGGSIKILDDDQNEMPVGEAGSIYVYLPMFGDFSYSNTDGDLKGQRYGQHATVGDIGYLDEDDYLFISDRKKDMIISGGANIFPAEIEAALIEMPGIVDCAVFGAPHAEFGEMVVAAVEQAPGREVTLESMQGFLEPRIARFKIPRKLDVHETLPREDSGKIFKQRLRAPYWEETGRKI